VAIQESAYLPSTETRAALRQIRTLLVEKKPRLTTRERAAIANLLEHVSSVAELSRRGKSNGTVVYTAFAEGEVDGSAWECSVNRLVENLLR
jgi:hypothetical protein